jgi:hypothetical protein
MSLIGREDSPATQWNDLAEEIRWIGKPWRRIELLTQRHYWKGEQTEVNRTLSFHLGRRGGGFNATLTLSHDHYDYSEERP